MAYFEWADDMVIDNGLIDKDHHHLVDLVNELHTATSEGRGQEIVAAVIDKLIAYTVGHLQREEHLMESIHFKNLAQHKISHQKFIESLQSLQQKYKDGSITVASQLSTVLRDWLSLHIRRNDKELVALLKPHAAKISAALPSRLDR